MDSPLDAKLSGALGGRTAAAIEKGLGLVTVGDLLTHYPRRYALRGELTALAQLSVDENVTIVAEVLGVQERTMRARKGSILEVTISDGSAILSLTFFNQAWRKADLKPGVRGIFAGKVGDYRGTIQLAHPDYELFETDDTDADSEAAAERARKWAEQPVPIYAATAAVASWQLGKAIEVLLDTLPPLDDPVPGAVRGERGLMNYSRALALIHRPQKDIEWRAAQKSLRFQEAFVLQAALLEQRALLKLQSATARVPKPGGLLERFDAQLLSKDGALKFDVARNWALVSALLSDESIELKWVFVSNALRDSLLAHARRSKVPRSIIAAAEKVLHQPSDAPPHDDHFHVRIRCTKDERDDGCVD